MKTEKEIIEEIKKRIQKCDEGDIHSFLEAKDLGLMQGTLKALLDWIVGR